MSDLENVVVCQDNIQFMSSLSPKSIDLIYIDPPFFTQKDFGDFDDRWKSLDHFLTFLVLRLCQCHRLLKDTGIFCLHLDWRTIHYAKTKCDQIFGYNNFVNEIIWEFSAAGQRASRNYKKSHSTILIYSKTKNYHAAPERGPLADATLRRYGKSIDGNGNVTVGSLMKNDPKLYRNHLRQGRVRDFDAHDKVIFSTTKGTILKDCWSDLKNPPYRGSGAKNKKYETQKPLGLLERIVKSFSPENGVVGDFFCGSGTTLVAAKKLGRAYIGCDISSKAVEISRERIECLK